MKARRAPGLRSNSPAVVLPAEPCQRERAERETEVAERHVEKAWNHEQISYDQQQPRRYDVCEDARLEGHPEPRHDLDHPDRHHQLVAVAARQIVDERREVLIPVHQQVKKFVEPGHNRRDRKAKVENLIRLIAGPRHALALSLHRGYFYRSVSECLCHYLCSPSENLLFTAWDY